ncbi:dTMP kinase [Lihuaxuella thermophila]|uniref:Thymidylate kinase n=1 Tax=Lihuaxuella thermophila TaxID=1173111 RepID=A0A1H8CWY5_9BACL|nr:dTMP kinase [Lihuaxuella thermophila]SEM99623.1 dTMP kinase [Lihuaxuella thermophila]
MDEKQAKLIVFEGAGRSGKSTLIHLVKNALEKRGMQTTFTEWNSYPSIQRIINQKKVDSSFTPLTYCLLHLAEFALRYEEIIQPALKKADVVLADRWVYTAWTRDSARGIENEYVRQCYQFAKKPDCVFYIEVPSDIALQRHIQTKPFFGYNAGVDIWPDRTKEEAFLLYHQHITQHYSLIAEEENFVVLNGLESSENLLHQALEHLKSNGFIACEESFK